MGLADYKEKYFKVKSLKGEEALAAVQRDCYALRHVCESLQTEAMCLAAVQQDEDACNM